MSTTTRSQNQNTETAINLAFAWCGTDTLYSSVQVRQAVTTSGEVPECDVDAVVDALLPLLRRNGILKDDELVIVALKGGDSSSARAAVCLDLERGNVTNGEEWAALVRGDRLEELLDQTAAQLVRGPDLWDGTLFGDGVCGTVERAEDGSIRGSGLYRPGLAAPSITAKDEQ